MLKQRSGFASKIGTLTATLGSAIGLGNIWMFSYKTGENGGASFLILYLLCTLLLAIPAMIAEIAIGRRGKTNSYTSLKNQAPGTPWFIVGIIGALASIFIMSFYTDVVGWVISYFIKAFEGSIVTTDISVTGAQFHAVSGGVWHALGMQVFVCLAVATLLIKGARGIEKITKLLIPVLLILLIALCIRSLTLDRTGVLKGLKYLFSPDFSKITVNTFLAALGLAFFKLSLGVGTMLTYGSYFRRDQNIPNIVIKVVLADLFVSLLAGVTIFSAAFVFGIIPSGGPGLLFVTIPTVFASMAFGQYLMIIFFFLTILAATGAMISLLEVPVAIFTEITKIGRTKCAYLGALVLICTGSLATLSYSVLADFKIFGLTFFDLYMFMAEKLIMPVCAFCFCIFFTWYLGFKEYNAEIDSGQGWKWCVRPFFLLTKWVAPVGILVLLLVGLGIIKF